MAEDNLQPEDDLPTEDDLQPDDDLQPEDEKMESEDGSTSLQLWEEDEDDDYIPADSEEAEI